MIALRKGILVLLAVDLVAANAAVATDRTVLNSDYVRATLERRVRIMSPTRSSSVCSR